MSQRQKKSQLAFIFLVLATIILVFKPVRSFLDKNLVSSSFFVSPQTGQNAWFYNLFHLVAFTNDYNNVKIQNRDLITNYLNADLTNIPHSDNEITGLEARILKSDTSNSGSYFWINKGTLDGITAGMNVVGEANAVLGVVSNVYSHSSLVRNLLSPKTKISVMDLRSKSLGIATVNSQGKFYLDYLQLKSDIQINDLLVATPDNKEYLAGLVVGKVVQEDKDNQTYYLESLIDIRRTFEVKVLTQPSKR